tara:strand:- start:875 stop:1390 length:516 start_codon:yes stop_codon:yes gene_type:complete
MQLDNFITVGKVLSSFGLKGQVKVDVYLEDLTILKTVDIFCIGDSLQESKIHFLKKIKNSKWLVAIPGTKNKEQADQLKGHLIYIETKYLPSLMTDEFYYKDLRGLQIKIEGSVQKGFINDICNFGSGDILEVSLDDRKASIYIPFNKDNVSKIDLANRKIILTPLKGLLV